MKPLKNNLIEFEIQKAPVLTTCLCLHAFPRSLINEYYAVARGLERKFQRSWEIGEREMEKMKNFHETAKKYFPVCKIP